MNIVPRITTVADMQRNYRMLIDSIKETGEPLIVVSNGKPDAVVLDVNTYNAKAERLKELEEDYLLKLSREAMIEHKRGKTLKMRDGETLIDVLKRINEH